MNATREKKKRGPWAVKLQRIMDLYKWDRPRLAKELNVSIDSIHGWMSRTNSIPSGAAQRLIDKILA